MGDNQRTVPVMATTTNTPLQSVLPDREAPEIWSIHEIANFYRRSVRQASRIVRDATFPRPMRGDRGRWFASDVIAFAVSSDHGDDAHAEGAGASLRTGIVTRKAVPLPGTLSTSMSPRMASPP